MIRFFYNLLWPIGLIAFLPGYLVKMVRRGGYRKNFNQRFGFYSSDLRARWRTSPPIWIHAVSVGEVIIALKLVRVLQAEQTDLRIVLSTTTTTGYALAQKSSSPQLDVIYFSLDFWPIMRRAFNAIKPRTIVLIEAEVWPNLVAQAKQCCVPVVLANARLSPRSEARFARFKRFVSPIFQKLALVCVSTETDAARWHSLGVDEAKIKVVGSIKYDERRSISAEPQRVLEQLRIDPDRPVLLGGSTHRGEEKFLANVFAQLRGEIPNLFLVLAPRHVERCSEIERELAGVGLKVARRSKPDTTSVDVLLLDTTGELREWYGIATVVFVGKSLTARGGQNPVEAIAAGAPVIFGPRMENFAGLAHELTRSKGAIQVNSVAELKAKARTLLHRGDLRADLSANALKVIAKHAGATERTAHLIGKLSAAARETEPCNR